MQAFGIDLVSVKGFTEQLEMPGTTFILNFTASEISDTRSGKVNSSSAESLAGKWAAKESFIKAWSMICFAKPPAIPRDDVKFCEIEVLHDAHRRPFIKLHGEVGRKFYDEFPDAEVRVSISHDGDYAVAQCGIIYV